MTEAIAALLVEDDERLARFTADYLVDHEIDVTHVNDGDAALVAVARQRFDVIVLDIVLPTRNGISVCQGVRERSDVPIVIVSARVEEADRVLGLEAGADDYVVKPFSPRELLARIRSVVRRDRGQLSPRSRPIRVGSLVIQSGARTVTLAGKPVELTSAEFDLLSALATRPGRTLSREQLLKLARGHDERTFDRAIDVQISRIRHKLSALPGGARLIRTVRGVGYMLGES